MKIFTAGIVAMLLTASPAFAEVRLTMHDGRVTIVAKDATVRQILTEWARVGQTRIINVERIPGGPVTLVLENVTEMQALEVLLRPLSGYIAAPRAIAAANLSAYDRVIIMPTLADTKPAAMVSASAYAAPVFSPPPVYQQPAPVVQSTDDDPISETSVGGQSVAGGSAPPTPAAIAAQAVAATSAQAVAAGAPETVGGESTPTSYPRGLEVGRRVIDARITSRPPAPNDAPPSGGVAVPGMIAPAPRGQPGQPPGAPGQPVRRPGGL